MADLLDAGLDVVIEEVEEEPWLVVGPRDLGAELNVDNMRTSGVKMSSSFSLNGYMPTKATESIAVFHTRSPLSSYQRPEEKSFLNLRSVHRAMSALTMRSACLR